MLLPSPIASGHGLPTSSESIGSSWSMPVTVMVTGSPSGSATPTMETSTNLWFGGHSRRGSATAAVQSGDPKLGVVVVVDDVVVVVDGRVLVVVLLEVVVVVVDGVVVVVVGVVVVLVVVVVVVVVVVDVVVVVVGGWVVVVVLDGGVVVVDG